MYVCMYACMYVCNMYVCMNGCVCVRARVYVCVCMCVESSQDMYEYSKLQKLNYSPARSHLECIIESIS